MRARNLVYPLGSALGAAAVLRRLGGLVLPDVVSVVLYHGLVDTPLAVPSPLFLPVERFVTQIEYLARNFTVLHLEEAFAPDRPRGERPVACVTFDDGFASLHDLALPVLERFSVPATVYLVTDLVDGDGVLWYTRLHEAVSGTRIREVRLGDRRFLLRTPAERARASFGLQEELKCLPRPRFEPAFQELLDRLGARRRTGGPTEATRILGSREIRRMSRGDLVRFGSHTATHQILTRTDPADVEREIGRSVAAVASLVRRPSRSFAYPNGGCGDFDAGTVAALRRAGIEYAVTTIEGANPRGVDPYRILRYTVSAADPPGRFAWQVHHARVLLAALTRGTPRAGVPGDRGGRS